MRAVTKGEGHFQLNQRHNLHQQELQNGTASPEAWDNFRGKPETRQCCWNEQFGLCAFSEIMLDDDLGMHLDHVEPKSLNPARTFDHTNLLLCAFSSEKLKNISRNGVFGGQFRLNAYSRTDLITPLWPDSRRFFHYAADGRVEPTLGLPKPDVTRASYTINLLNLNSPLLVNRRRRWLEELESEIDKLLDSPEALERFADARQRVDCGPSTVPPGNDSARWVIMPYKTTACSAANGLTMIEFSKGNLLVADAEGFAGLPAMQAFLYGCETAPVTHDRTAAQRRRPHE